MRKHSIIARIRRRIFYTYRQTAQEIQSVSTFEPEERRQFLLFMLIRAYWGLALHLPLGFLRPAAMFRLRELVALAPKISAMRRADPRLNEMVNEFSIKGVRAWEYGTFLSLSDLSRSPRVLDVGPGSSSFPFYLSRLGARVMTVELPDPMERPSEASVGPSVRSVGGSVVHLPFREESFDLVTCISTIEHLDSDYPEGTLVSREVFIRRTRRALSEMTRVLKRGGRLYLTTDAYLPRQKTDRWILRAPHGRIVGAYRFSDIRRIFMRSLQENGCVNLLPSRNLEEALLQSAEWANYRGRWFTTFALWMRKVR